MSHGAKRRWHAAVRQVAIDCSARRVPLTRRS